jgi:hypothetical protein
MPPHRAPSPSPFSSGQQMHPSGGARDVRASRPTSHRPSELEVSRHVRPPVVPLAVQSPLAHCRSRHNRGRSSTWADRYAARHKPFFDKHRTFLNVPCSARSRRPLLLNLLSGPSQRCMIAPSMSLGTVSLGSFDKDKPGGRARASHGCPSVLCVRNHVTRGAGMGAGTGKMFSGASKRARRAMLAIGWSNASGDGERAGSGNLDSGISGVSA